MKAWKFAWVFAVGLFIAMDVSVSHITGSGAGSGPKRVGRAGTGTSLLEENDSLKASLDFYAYYSDSWVGKKNAEGPLNLPFGVRSGDPLGGGGKLPLYYNYSLYREQPHSVEYLFQKDLRPQYQDFSYIPLWQPLQISARMRYRFFPRVWGTLSLEFVEDDTKINAGEAYRRVEVGEVTFKWAPKSVPGLYFRAGTLRLFGTYHPLFDQFPLENYAFNGLRTEYTKDLGKVGGFNLNLTGGKENLGRTTNNNGYVGTAIVPTVYIDRLRERNHLLGALRWWWPWGLSAGVLGGYQSLPRDSTNLLNSGKEPFPYILHPSRGWHLGIELSYKKKKFDNFLTLSYGRGNVQLGWGVPDPVLDSTLDSTSIWRFNREGSSLTQLTYWAQYRTKGYGVEGGLWWQYRSPAKKEFNHYWFYNAERYSMTLIPERFRAIKFALKPYLVGFRNWNVGFRYDYIHYLDPDARTNSVETPMNQALEPIPNPDGTGLNFFASRWDREAVNSHVISPFVKLKFGGGLNIRASWSGAFYGMYAEDKKWQDSWTWTDIYRQGEADNFHHNFTLAVWLTYRLAKLDEL